MRGLVSWNTEVRVFPVEGIAQRNPEAGACLTEEQQGGQWPSGGNSGSVAEMRLER